MVDVSKRVTIELPVYKTPQLSWLNTPLRLIATEGINGTFCAIYIFSPIRKEWVKTCKILYLPRIS